MNQKNVWEREYSKQKLVSIENKPHADIVRLVRLLEKNYGLNFSESQVLDIGCGTGKNAYYFATLGAKVFGIDFSENAIRIANQNAKIHALEITYLCASVGEILTIDTNSTELIIDILATNSLNADERDIFISERNRVLKPGGFYFIRTLAKEGDQNAHYLLKNNPGIEENTYIMPEIGLTERVFTKEEISSIYGNDFDLVSIQKKAHYPKIDGRTYKRQFYYALFRKPL